MLFLLFQLGDDRYALEAARVVEVLPLLQLKKIPQAPRGVAGAFNYRGTPAPVVDLCACALDRPAAPRLSTRLIMVRADRGTIVRHLGLIAEKATDTMRRDPAEFVAAGVTAEGARYLGPVAPDPRGGLIQWIEVEKLLPPEVRDGLFRQLAEGA